MSKQVETGKPHGAMPAARMASEERRQQIVRVAMRLFSQRGFRGTTTKEIAQAAGVSEAIIFRHFATKEELYAAILDHKACTRHMDDVCVEVEEAIKRGDDRTFLAHVALTMMEHHEQDSEFPRLLLHSALEEHELFLMFRDKVVREMADFLCGYIRERQKAGAIRDVDPLVVARAFMGMVIYHSLVNILFDKSRSLLDITNEKAAYEFTEILLRGISIGPPAENGKRIAPQNKKKK